MLELKRRNLFYTANWQYSFLASKK